MKFVNPILVIHFSYSTINKSYRRNGPGQPMVWCWATDGIKPHCPLFTNGILEVYRQCFVGCLVVNDVFIPAFVLTRVSITLVLRCREGIWRVNVRHGSIYPSNTPKIFPRLSKSGLEYRKRFRFCLLPAFSTSVSHLKFQPWL